MKGEELECLRCLQVATKTAARRGHCTACGAPLVRATGPKEANVRALLSGRFPPLNDKRAAPDRHHTGAGV